MHYTGDTRLHYETDQVTTGSVGGGKSRVAQVKNVWFEEIRYYKGSGRCIAKTLTYKSKVHKLVW